MDASLATAPRRRGRPPKAERSFDDTRRALLQAGMALLTERGFAATGLDALLRGLGVPKGSFYHYFASKEAFGLEVLAAYDAYFCRKLERHLQDTTCDPLARIAQFVDDAAAGLARFAYARGCLVGNLGQEVVTLPALYRAPLVEAFHGWEQRLQQCLHDAQAAGQLRADADCATLARYFWMGWEGAVLRARLERSGEPLAVFLACFLAGLPR
ncbi:TetR family transcriptional regulator C-terminal domain-containing protein [Stenotrophomonas sp.]|uniref:acrylate utilization transcriptional regulator AcuR n=1 Tax=Stenotrophomonas sp. TaxID=69392 RepID=UPI002FC94E17